MSKRKKKAKTDGVVDAELREHIVQLGLTTVEEYRAWCLQQGLSPRLIKSWKQRCRERFHARQDLATQRLEQNRRERKAAPAVLRDLCQNRIAAESLSSPHLKRLAELLRDLEEDSARTRFRREDACKLLEHVAQQSPRLLTGNPAIDCLGNTAGNSHIEAIGLMSAHAERWRRDPQDWKPQTRNLHRQVASLMRHLFVAYEMPEFFDSVWYQGRTRSANRQREWFLHVATGANIRLCDLPISMTKRMAHTFMRAPRQLTVLQAIRWSQVINLGGSRGRAQAILGTRLGEQFSHEEFWITVIRWLIRYGEFPNEQIGPLFDYLQHQRYGRDVVTANGTWLAAQPNLTMKGRTPRKLLRDMESWHRELASSNRIQLREWSTSEIPGFTWTEGQGDSARRWTIRELLSSRALVAEGKQMRHCVAGYSPVCVRRESGIWTMEVESQSTVRKSLTIEVDLRSRKIVQARGKSNRLPDERERRVMARWASRVGLTVAHYV